MVMPLAPTSAAAGSNAESAGSHAAGASVAVASAAGASVAAAGSVAGASVAGASVAVAPPQAERTKLASTSSDRKANRFCFTFLLLREIRLIGFAYKRMGNE